MKKIIGIAIVLTLIGFIPLVHQTITGCAAFGYKHLTAPTVITTADSCASDILAIPLIPSVQLSRLLSFNSVYMNYWLLGIMNILIYTSIGYILSLLLFRQKNGN